ncbi:unnamed protein product, partial [Mesorhabditis spiculigera]
MPAISTYDSSFMTQRQLAVKPENADHLKIYICANCTEMTKNLSKAAQNIFKTYVCTDCQKRNVAARFPP